MYWHCIHCTRRAAPRHTGPSPHDGTEVFARSVMTLCWLKSQLSSSSQSMGNGNGEWCTPWAIRYINAVIPSSRQVHMRVVVGQAAPVAIADAETDDWHDDSAKAAQYSCGDKEGTRRVTEIGTAADWRSLSGTPITQANRCDTCLSGYAAGSQGARDAHPLLVREEGALRMSGNSGLEWFGMSA
jgi:hypothetical protein